MNAPVTAASIAADLSDEQDLLDTILSRLTDTQWKLATPSPRWRIHEQVGHLAYFDHSAMLAITDPAAFAAHREQFVTDALGDPDASDRITLGPTSAMDPAQLLDHWRAGRHQLADAAATLADDTRVTWYGPSMGAKSFLTARLMEVWAHGQDIVDTLGVDRRNTDRLRHTAQLGVITRGWTYVNRGLTVPDGEVRVELVSPSGEKWTWGPIDASARVSGTAVDFCLVTTQRRNLDDTKLVMEGEIARDWLEKAQLFAGPPTDPPASEVDPV